MRRQFQTPLSLLYPPRCLGCGALVDSEFGLCGTCWRDTPFIGGTVCDRCGAPQHGIAGEDPIECDDCLRHPRPWARGRAALLYEGRGRKMILALKHGDRTDMVRPAGRWLAGVARPLLRPHSLIVPVPLHWTRLLRRRYNQSALLARSLASVTDRDAALSLLQRVRKTDSLGRKTVEERVETMASAIRVAPRQAMRIAGRPVLIVDDVMTTGATLAACAEACREAGAAEVCVVVLARAAKGA